MMQSIMQPIMQPIMRGVMDARRSGFSVRSLFAKDQQGAWYDPSDLSTLFQDAAGTIPVTGTGQPVGLMLDKSGRGHHATKPTAASRPIYRRGDSRGVVNLLLRSSEFDNAVWVKSGGMTVTPNAVAAPGGSLTADKLVEGTTPSVNPLAIQVGTFPPGSQITASCRIKAGGRGFVRFQIAASNGNTYAATRFNLTTGAKVVTDSDVALNGATNVSSSIVAEGEGYYLCSLSCKVPPGIVSARLEIRLVPDATTFSYTGDGASGVYAHGAQLNLGPTELPYQRNDGNLGGVATGDSTDLHWLETDGVDDGMVTGSIDFTGTDKMFVCAGLRTQSTVTAAVVELSADVGANNGTFLLAAPVDAGNNFRFRAKGTLRRDATSTPTYHPPVSVVAVGQANIPGYTVAMRLNGTPDGATEGDLGTGNFGNYPLYLFRRGGITLPFNGFFYGAIIAGAAYSASQIASAERYLAGKSGVTL